MLYPPVALERAMTIREVVLRAMSGEISWIQAAEIIGCTPRSVRRWRGRFARDGYFGLLDRRRGRPSPRRGALPPSARPLARARDTYPRLLAALSRTVRRLQRAALLPDRAPRARGDVVLHVREDGSAEGRPAAEASGAR